MKLQLYAVALLSVLAITSKAEERHHKKRQIYREQVLPHAGGRIPDTAFETDRLFLNRLQKEGIAIPDGIVPEQRHPQVYPFTNKRSRSVYRIALSLDGRYTSKEGKFRYNEVPSIETTYLLPQVHGQTLRSPLKHKQSLKPAYPIYKKFELHNNQLNQMNFQAKKKELSYQVTPKTIKGNGRPYKVETYQNFNIINTPLHAFNAMKSFTHYNGKNNNYNNVNNNYNYNHGNKFGGATNVADSARSSRENRNNAIEYGSPPLFNKLDDLFNEFELHNTEDSTYEKPTIYHSTYYYPY